MYTLPQEIEVWYVIPAIRRELAKCLTGHHGMSYERVGKMLGISKAAISQYVKNKRAAKIRLPEQALKEIGKACKKLVAEKSSAVVEITRILKFIREKGLVLEVCKDCEGGVLAGCKEIRFDVATGNYMI